MWLPILIKTIRIHANFYSIGPCGSMLRNQLAAEHASQNLVIYCGFIDPCNVKLGSIFLTNLTFYGMILYTTTILLHPNTSNTIIIIK
jgi:hypothetical protein